MEIKDAGRAVRGGAMPLPAAISGHSNADRAGTGCVKRSDAGAQLKFAAPRPALASCSPRLRGRSR